MYLGNGIFLKNTALMHVSIAVILTMASQSALSPPINLGPTEPSPNSPGLEVDMVTVVAVVAVMAKMAVEMVKVQDVGAVMGIKPTHTGSGKVMPRLSMQSPLLVALENVRASGA
jgi:hypothetical protein